LQLFSAIRTVKTGSTVLHLSTPKVGKRSRRKFALNTPIAQLPQQFAGYFRLQDGLSHFRQYLHAQHNM
jgi:hypothetical protein